MLHKIAKGFFNIHFPDFAWRAKFRAFDSSEGRSPEVDRLDCFEHLAKKEGHDGAQVRGVVVGACSSCMVFLYQIFLSWFM